MKESVDIQVLYVIVNSPQKATQHDFDQLYEFVHW